MLSRSGVSIRRLISPRRAQDEYEDGYSVDTDRMDFKTGRKDSIGSIGPQLKRRTYSKRRPPPPIIVSREQSIHDILDPLPPLPLYDTPPRSRSSSLNSCERHYDYLSQSVDSKRSKSPLCSISSKDDRSQESLQLSSSVTSYGGDDIPPPPPPKSYRGSPESFKQQAEFSSSNLDLIEALSLRSDSRATTLQAPLGQRDSFSSYSDNIQQLIQEADEAFRAVGNALAEVQLANNSTKELPSLPTPEPSPVLQSSPILKPSPIPKSSPVLKPTPPATQNTVPTPQYKPPSPPVYTPRRTPSGSSGVKRKRSKKSKKVKAMKPNRKPAAKSTTKSGPIWNFSDNVTDLFSGKLFQKIEVDEMLTPDQLEEYRLRRMSISKPKPKPAPPAQPAQPEKLVEAIDTESMDTPIEPFHLEDLSSRIGSAGVTLDVDTPTEDRPTIPKFQAVVWRDSSTEGHNEQQRAAELPAPVPPTDIGEDPAQHKDSTFLTPPMNQAARLAGRKQRAALPSIPETAAISASKHEAFRGQDLRYSRDMVADSNYVFLQSSPCSLTSPTFRHGPIRLAKCDLVPDVKFGADDGLDWTAFQMAISGGAGDWFSESDDIIRRREAEEIDEIAKWFDSFHFTRPGGLVTHAVEAPSPTSTASGEDYSDVSCTDLEKDGSCGPQYQWQKPQHKIPEIHRPRYDMSGLELDTTRMSLNEQALSPTKDYGNRESYASLPQSPMLDLRIIRSPNGDDVDVVPMGYNLGHDLGDFLKWEAEHAYAGDFYTC